jgi:hypothetical protein
MRGIEKRNLAKSQKPKSQGNSKAEKEEGF